MESETQAGERTLREPDMVGERQTLTLERVQEQLHGVPHVFRGRFVVQHRARPAVNLPATLAAAPVRTRAPIGFPRIRVRHGPQDRQDDADGPPLHSVQSLHVRPLDHMIEDQNRRVTE